MIRARGIVFGGRNSSGPLCVFRLCLRNRTYVVCGIGTYFSNAETLAKCRTVCGVWEECAMRVRMRHSHAELLKSSCSFQLHGELIDTHSGIFLTKPASEHSTVGISDRKPQISPEDFCIQGYIDWYMNCLCLDSIWISAENSDVPERVFSYRVQLFYTSSTCVSGGKAQVLKKFFRFGTV